MNGGVMEVSSDFEYNKDKDIILSQKQHTLITVSDQNTYDQMVQTFQASQQANDYKDIKGVSYSFENNDENLSIDETIDINFNTISSDDYHVHQCHKDKRESGVDGICVRDAVIVREVD